MYILKYWPTSSSNNFWESNLLSTCTVKFWQDDDILGRYSSTLILLLLIVCKHNILSPHNHGIFFSILMCLMFLESSGCIFSFGLGDRNEMFLLTSLEFWFSLSSFLITKIFFRAVIAAGVFDYLNFLLPLFLCAWFVLFQFLITYGGVSGTFFTLFLLPSLFSIFLLILLLMIFTNTIFPGYYN